LYDNFDDLFCKKQSNHYDGYGNYTKMGINILL